MLVLLTLALSTLIIKVDAQNGCGPLSEKKCCWARKLYSGYGGNPKLIPINNCCGKSGVECNQNGQVVRVSWNKSTLRNPGSYPKDQVIDNLPYLKIMYFICTNL